MLAPGAFAGGSDGQEPGGEALLAGFAQAVREDLALLADLHDHEPTAAIIEAVRSGPVQDQFGVRLKDDASLAALEALWLAADQLPRPLTAGALDEVAAGYADVYLRHSFRAAPTESVWLAEDGLERQEPMLQVRAVYRRHGLKVADLQNRADDHIVLQLRFLSHLFQMKNGSADLTAAAGFMDAHILLWIRRFAVRLVNSGAPDWFAALALLTASYLDELRDHLKEITGIDRPVVEVPAARPEGVTAGEEDQPYIPGSAPSW